MQNRNALIKEKLSSICAKYTQPKLHKQLTGKKNKHHETCIKVIDLISTISDDDMPVLARALSDYLDTTNSKKFATLFNKEEIASLFTPDDWQALATHKRYSFYLEGITLNTTRFANLLAIYNGKPSLEISKLRNLDWALKTRIDLSNDDLLKTALYYAFEAEKLNKIIDSIAQQERLDLNQQQDLSNLIQLDGCLFVAKKTLDAIEEKIGAVSTLSFEECNQILINLNHIKDSLSNPEELANQLSDDSALKDHKARINAAIQACLAKANELSQTFDAEYTKRCTGYATHGPLHYHLNKQNHRTTDNDGFKYTKMSLAAPVTAVVLPATVGITTGLTSGKGDKLVRNSLIGIVASTILSPLTFSLGVFAGVVSLPFTAAADGINQLKNTVGSNHTSTDFSALQQKENELIAKLKEKNEEEKRQMAEKQAQEKTANDEKHIEATKASIQALLNPESRKKLEEVCELYFTYKRVKLDFETLNAKRQNLEKHPLNTTTHSHPPKEITELLEQFARVKMGFDSIAQKHFQAFKFPFSLTSSSRMRDENNFFFPYQASAYASEGYERTDNLIKHAITQLDAWLQNPVPPFGTLDNYKETLASVSAFIDTQFQDEKRKNWETSLSEKQGIIRDLTDNVDELRQRFQATETQMENVALKRPSFG